MRPEWGDCYDGPCTDLPDSQYAVAGPDPYLQNSEELLQFASDLSHRELFVYVPGQRKGTLVLAAHRTPLLQKGRQNELAEPGTVFSHYEEPLNYQVFQDGKAMHGEKEIEYGRTAPIVAYPFVDNGGITIAVIAFVAS